MFEGCKNLSLLFPRLESSYQALLSSKGASGRGHVGGLREEYVSWGASGRARA